MNIKQFVAAALVFSATGAAFAQQAEVSNIVSTKTRADVIAELRQAQADGTAASYGFLGTSNPAAAAGTANRTQSENVIVRGKTRAEVMAELKQAQADGTIIQNSFVAYDAPANAATTGGAKKAIANK